MAKFNFNLKNPKAKGETPIILRVNYDYKSVRFFIGESIEPKFWDKEKQRAKETSKFPTHPEFNQRLKDIDSTAQSIFRRYQNDNNHQAPAPGEYKKLLEEAIRGTKSGIPKTFFEFTEWFIAQTRKRLESEGKTSTRSDVAGSYNQTIICIRDFAKDKNRRIDFDSIDTDFYNDFKEYLQAVKIITKEDGTELRKYGFSLNNVGKHIKNLKRILNEAQAPNGDPAKSVNKFNHHKSKYFKVPKVEVDAIYLNEKELQAMYDLDLSNNSRLEKVRDLFLVGCWTGLRFTNFTNIRSQDIKGDFIHMETAKSGEKVVIPIHWTVKEIMKKYSEYDNSLPPAISNANMNLYLKELGKLLDSLHTMVSIEQNRAGTTVHKKKPKYELLTTHTARRSFATNMYFDGIPTVTIMKITGHKTEKAFLSYIRVTPEEHANIIMESFNKKRKLRVV